MSALDNAYEASYTTVLFEYNSGDQKGYTDHTTDLQGGLFESVPSMKLTIPENTGLFDGKVFRVVLPRVVGGVTDTFLDRLSSGSPHAPVAVTVTEHNIPQLGSDLADEVILFKGKLTKAVRNYQGRADAVALEGQTALSQLDAAMGMACNHHCIFNLFGRGCSTGDGSGGQEADGTAASGPQKNTETALVTITAIVGKTVTAIPPAKSDDRHWHRGYMEFEGLRIGIRDYDASVDANTFHLVNRPPSHWNGNQVDLVPGCDKSVETCDGRWGNKDNFGGFGYAIPAYNPLLENPS